MNIIFLPFIFALLGYLFSTHAWLKWFGTLSPIGGLGVYYVAVTITISILICLGLTVAGEKFNTISQLIGSVLIWFSVFVIIIWTNCYIPELLNGTCDGISNVYINTESGATYYTWSQLTEDIQKRRILTFMITPFVLSLVGILLVSEKIKIPLL